MDSKVKNYKGIREFKYDNDLFSKTHSEVQLKTSSTPLTITKVLSWNIFILSRWRSSRNFARSLRSQQQKLLESVYLVWGRPLKLIIPLLYSWMTGNTQYILQFMRWDKSILSGLRTQSPPEWCRLKHILTGNNSRLYSRVARTTPHML